MERKRAREKAACEWRLARRCRREMSKDPLGAVRMAGVVEVGERGWVSRGAFRKASVAVMVVKAAWRSRKKAEGEEGQAEQASGETRWVRATRHRNVVFR